jgi:hypothetical protein
MIFKPETTNTQQQTIREREAGADLSEPKPWTVPDFVERSTCAEIGAYALQDK